MVIPAVDSTANFLEDVTCKFAELTISHVSQYFTQNLTKEGTSQLVPMQPSETMTSTSTERVKRCFICGKSGEELKHPLHPGRCYEMPGLLTAGLVLYNASRNWYVLPGGEDLPILLGFPGGVAAYLRMQVSIPKPGPSGANKELPPHMTAPPAQVASTSTIGLTYGGRDVLSGDVFTVLSFPSPAYDVNLTTRSGKDTTNRYNPLQCPEVKPQGKGKESKPSPQALVKTQVTPNISIPAPTNPINRCNGWRESLPSNQPILEVSMGDDTVAKKSEETKRPTGPSYHFTSDVQEKADPSKVYDLIMNTTVSVPISEVIGNSPQLQKLFGESTRTRRVYTSKPSEYVAPAAITDEFDTDDTVVDTSLCTGNFDRFPEFLVRYSNTIAVAPNQKIFAMTTGSFTVQMGSVDLLVMVDSGSELNLAGSDVPERTGQPIDFERMKWSLRGIHGGPEQLQGVLPDAPIKIANHEFPHHLFVSHQSLGKHDIILGQLFLQWYASRFDYERVGSVKLYLWKDGDRTRPPTLCVSITDPADHRNTTVIGKSHLARIEEVPDDESFQR